MKKTIENERKQEKTIFRLKNFQKVVDKSKIFMYNKSRS